MKKCENKLCKNLFEPNRRKKRFCCHLCSMVNLNKSKEHIENNVKNFSQENSSSWKGEKAGYFAIHNWIRKYYGSADHCEMCGKTKGKFEWANISGEYKRDRRDFIPLCQPCHRSLDLGVSVVQKTLDGNIVKVYPTIAFAEKQLEIPKGGVSRILAGKRKSCRGFLWEYYNGKITNLKKYL